MIRLLLWHMSHPMAPLTFKITKGTCITNNKDLNTPYHFLLKSREKRCEQLVYSWNELTPTMQDILQRDKTDNMLIFDKMYK